MTVPERAAAALAAAGIAQGVVVALAAPHVPWYGRLARLLIDAVFTAGLVAYVRGARAPVAPARGLRRVWAIVERVAGVAIVGAGVAFVALVPGIDPWRRAYRIGTGVVLTLALAAGIPRALPAGWSRRAGVAALGIWALEYGALAIAYVEVDGPAAVAVAGVPARALVHRLDGEGIALPHGLAAQIAARDDTFAARGDRLVTSDDGADTLRLFGDDPAAGAARLLAAYNRPDVRNGAVDSCAFIEAMQPPVTGYRRLDDALDVLHATVRCARAAGRRDVADAALRAAAREWRGDAEARRRIAAISRGS